MRKQQHIWEEEHLKNDHWPGLTADEPASSVVFFVKYLLERGITPPLKVVDIGCGQGRNAIYLAEQGFEVYGLDYVHHAIERCQERAERFDLTSKLHLFELPIDSIWPFEDNFFDASIDAFSSIDIETQEGRLVYKMELLRTLKPGGYALITAVSAADEWEKDLLMSHPGPEPHSTIWPNGKFQKDYIEAELREFYQEFEILDLREISKPAVKLGKEYTKTDFWMVLRKHSFV
ncbi:MAG: class I SAM-dependent methyltransferase [Patescibacteria group bacterium]